MIENRDYLRRSTEEKLEKILPVAEKLFAEKGFASVTMKEIMAAVDIPRSTFIYLIPNMETLIIYLAVRGFNKLFTYVDRGMQYEACGKVKFLAIYLAFLFFIRLEPTLNKCICEANAPRYRDAVSDSLMALYDTKMNEVIGYIQRTIELSMYKDEIKLPTKITPHHLAFYIYSGWFGVMSIAMSKKANLVEATKQYKYYVRQLLDALPWHPKSTEVDMDLEAEKIVGSIFAKEFMTLKHLNIEFK